MALAAPAPQEVPEETSDAAPPDPQAETLAAAPAEEALPPPPPAPPPEPPAPAEPPPPPRPETLQGVQLVAIIGVFRRDMTRRFQAMASLWLRSSASIPG